MSLLTDVKKTAAALLTDRAAWEPTTRRALGFARAAWALRGCEVGPRVAVMGPLDVENLGRVQLGDHVYFLPGMLTSQLLVGPGAELSVGPSSGFNFGVQIEARRRITIGARCMFASMVTLRDFEGDRIEPIVIGDDVWVAHGASVGPGVSIGAGSAVSAGTRVTRNVPAKHLAIGEPARNVRLDTLTRAR